jgi:hypothetical protein
LVKRGSLIVTASLSAGELAGMVQARTIEIGTPPAWIGEHDHKRVLTRSLGSIDGIGVPSSAKQ